MFITIRGDKRTMTPYLTSPPEYITFLNQARQSRLLVRACPAEADHYKSCARYWLAMAHRAQGPPLP
jgi:hypothetical protein